MNPSTYYNQENHYEQIASSANFCARFFQVVSFSNVKVELSIVLSQRFPLNQVAGSSPGFVFKMGDATGTVRAIVGAAIFLPLFGAPFFTCGATCAL